MEEPEDQPDAVGVAALQRMIGPYVLLRELGRGGAATVYKALDSRDHSVVALKALASVPYNQNEDQMSLLVRMERETRAVEALSHPNIVRILDVGFAGDSPENLIPYFAMEFLSGETLRQRLDRDGMLPLEVAQTILDQAASALDAVHESGIVHRDIKPANLMLMKNNVVKLMDFGIARQDDDATVTRAGMMVGSPAYMSPEQAVGEAATKAADVWGLSVVLFEMVCGQPPFEGPNIPAILYNIRHGDPLKTPSTVPSSVSTVLLRALNRDASRRYTTASGLAKAFREAIAKRDAPLAAEPIAAKAAPLGSTDARPYARKRSIHSRLALAYSAPIIVIAVAVMGALFAGAVLERATRARTVADAQKASATAKSEPAKTSPVSVKEVVTHSPAKKYIAAEKAKTLRNAVPARPAPIVARAPMAPAPGLPARTNGVYLKPPISVHGVAARLPHPAPPAVTTSARNLLAENTAPQPMPAPSAASLSPSPSPDVNGEPAGADKPAIDTTAVSGVWHGTYASHPALLVVNRPSPDDGIFDGTLTVSLPKGTIVVDVRGHVGDHGSVRFHEQSVISGDSTARWSLGSVSGSVNSGSWFAGSGKAVDGHAYVWNFHR